MKLYSLEVKNIQYCDIDTFLYYDIVINQVLEELDSRLFYHILAYPPYLILIPSVAAAFLVALCALPISHPMVIAPYWRGYRVRNLEAF